jgi:serine/threonine protein kinase
MDETSQRAIVGGFDLAQLVGQLIADRYRVDALLGSGGAGAVLRCRHVWLDTDVAIKVLHPELCTRPEIMRRFEQEARSASRLDHTNCVRVLDFGSWSVPGGRESKYLCMELLWGVELTRLLDQPLGPAFAVDVARQTLDGLAHAHARGVVHRDVKPQNVLVVAGSGSANVVKLVDFGIATILGRDDSIPRRNRQICGTPSYMSPEQASGGVVDGRSDLYAVGVLLYRMLAGRLPFEANDVRRVLQMQLTEEPPPLPTRTPVGLRRVVERLLRKDPGERYQTAELARAELLTVSAEPQPRRRSDVISLGEAFPRPSTEPRNATLVESQVDDAPAPQVLPRRRAWPKWLRPSPTMASLAAAALLVFMLLQLGHRAEPQPSAAIDALAETAVAAAPATVIAAPTRTPLERARRLAESPSTRARAIGAYDQALDREPSLLDDPHAFAEITALVRDPHLRGAALDLVLEHFGSRGGPLLVELLNTTLMPLAYEDRQRALAVIAHDARLMSLVDQRHLDALDLEEASRTTSPCVVFAAALARVDKAADPIALELLQGVHPPSAPLDADETTTALCARLPDLLHETRDRLARARAR